MPARFRWKQLGFSLGDVLVAGMWFAIVVLSMGCQKSEDFVSSSVTETFVQNFNPKYLEVLWVIDDRSPMYNAKSNIVTQATQFFTNIDSVSEHYRMGLVSTDMQFAQGALQPKGSKFVLTEGYTQSAADRAAVFSSLLGNVINLQTGYEDRGFEAALTALNGEFGAQPNIPLVLIFISYADDVSHLPSGTTDAVTYYQQQFLKVKGGNPDLVRVYSINYEPLPSGVLANSADAASHRCALEYNNPIDISPASYLANYFGLANTMSGFTGDLCDSAGFASKLDLSGLTLKALPNTFVLKSIPVVATLQVSITDTHANAVTVPPWVFDAGGNQIIFSTTPPEGTTITVTYVPAGKATK